MNRRTLLGRFAAIAAAVAVAPAVKAEASSSKILGNPLEIVGNRRKPLSLTTLATFNKAGWTFHEKIQPTIDRLTTIDRLIAEARAEGYERGRTVQAAADDSILAERSSTWPFGEKAKD